MYITETLSLALSFVSFDKKCFDSLDKKMISFFYFSLFNDLFHTLTTQLVDILAFFYSKWIHLFLEGSIKNKNLILHWREKIEKKSLAPLGPINSQPRRVSQ